jgi:hypothetical protein
MNAELCWTSEDDMSIAIERKGHETVDFTFNRVFTPANSQDEVYEDVGR